MEGKITAQGLRCVSTGEHCLALVFGRVVADMQSLSPHERAHTPRVFEGILRIRTLGEGDAPLLFRLVLRLSSAHFIHPAIALTLTTTHRIRFAGTPTLDRCAGGLLTASERGSTMPRRRLRVIVVVVAPPIGFRSARLHLLARVLPPTFPFRRHCCPKLRLVQSNRRKKTGLATRSKTRG